MIQGISFEKDGIQADIQVFPSQYTDSVQVIAVVRDRQGGKLRKYALQIAGPVEWVEFGEGMEFPHSTFSLPRQVAMQLHMGLNRALGEIGDLPKDQIAAEAELKATKVHLEDMRALVFQRDPAMRLP